MIWVSMTQNKLQEDDAQKSKQETLIFICLNQRTTIGTIKNTWNKIILTFVYNS